MATTNLVYKSLGTMQVQSGQGTPDHIAPKGSLYTNTITGTLYQNTDGSTAWINYTKIAYGGISLQNNTGVTTLGTVNVWVIPTLIWTKNDCNGTDIYNNKSLRISVGRAGKYLIMLSSTLKYTTANNIYEGAVFLNGTTAVTAGLYQSVYLTSTVTDNNITVVNYMTLADNDYLTMGVRNLTTGANVIIKNADLVAIRVDDV